MPNDTETGLNLQLIRSDRGMSQVYVAELMRAEGHKWAQNTVSSVESGERPLRLSEAAALANVFGVELHELSQPKEKTAAKFAVENMELAWDAYRSAAAEYIDAYKEMRKYQLDDIAEEERPAFLRFANNDGLMLAIGHTLNQVD
jgi:transcriptional regulator with XRE-family HTH domain